MENKLDINFYKTFYLDIHNLHFNDDQVREHFKNHGIYEKRFPSKEYFYKYYCNFSESFYRTCNKDIENFNEIDLIRHYHFYGVHEKRIASIKDFYNQNPDFDINIYKKFNTELADYNEISLIKHFILYGKDECRVMHKSEIKNYTNLLFNINIYRQFHPESINLSKKELKNEYLNSKKTQNIYEQKIGCISDFYGIFPDFNEEIYICFNQIKENDDLVEENKTETEKLFIEEENTYSNTPNNLNLSDDKNNLDEEENISFQNDDLDYSESDNDDLDDNESDIYNYVLEDNESENNDLQDNDSENDDLEENDDLDENNNIQIIILVDFYKKFMENKKIIYSLKSFYEHFPDFNYMDFTNTYKSNFEKISEVESIIYFYKNKIIFSSNNKTETKFKNIIIYPHKIFDLSDGGITVQYYLAQLLEEMGFRVRIYKLWELFEKNTLFNNYYNNDFDLNETIVIYSEGIVGNPLNAKYVVRWLLSQLGRNVPKNRFYTWGKNDLVYYFNNEEKFYEKKEDYNIIYKNLSMLYINPGFKNNNESRSGTCFTLRKSHYHKDITFFHPKNSFEITKKHTQNDYIEIFNKHKYLISYDPLTFLINIATLCGCITIVHPINNKSKQDWLKTTALWPYLEANNLDNIYGVAYGKDDILHASKTINLASIQWEEDISKYNIEKSLLPFINDIQNFDLM